MLYNENLHEEERHLIQQIAEQTERGKIGWELTEYNPLPIKNRTSSLDELKSFYESLPSAKE